MLFHTFLYLHVIGAIIAFGPIFTFPILGAMIGSEPQHGNFGIRFNHKVARGIIVPMVGFQGLTGLGLIITSGVNLTKAPWLGVGIILYLVLYSIGLFILTPATNRLAELTSSPPPPGAAGPPPEVQALAARSRIFGIVAIVLVVVIVFLMVIKPGA